METNFIQNKKEWLFKNGFNENEITYIYIGNDSYNIKDELKAAGFIYNPSLLWHKAERDEKYIDKLIEINLNEIAEWTAWGAPWFHDNANQIIKNKLDAALPQSNSEWLEGDKVKNLKATVTRIGGYDGQWGYVNVYTFISEDDNICVWFTSKCLDVVTGDKIIISGTIKDRKEYRNQKQTILTRCKVQKGEE